MLPLLAPRSFHGGGEAGRAWGSGALPISTMAGSRPVGFACRCGVVDAHFRWMGRSFFKTAPWYGRPGLCHRAVAKRAPCGV